LNGKSVFWIGHVALISLVSIGIAPAGAATKARAKTSRSSTAAKTPSRGAYSAARAQSRKTKLAQARAVAMAREMADTVVPRYKVDASGELVPDVRAAAAIIYDPVTNQILWEENGLSQRSIASITKVMTATVFLENNPDVSQLVTIDRSDVFQASTTHLIRNDKVSAVTMTIAISRRNPQTPPRPGSGGSFGEGSAAGGWVSTSWVTDAPSRCHRVRLGATAGLGRVASTQPPPFRRSG